MELLDFSNGANFIHAGTDERGMIHVIKDDAHPEYQGIAYSRTHELDSCALGSIATMSANTGQPDALRAAVESAEVDKDDSPLILNISNHIGRPYENPPPYVDVVRNHLKRNRVAHMLMTRFRITIRASSGVTPT